MNNKNSEHPNSERKLNIKQTLVKSILDDKRIIKSKNQNQNTDTSFRNPDITKYILTTKTLQSL